jgi:hypothetical protein
MKRFLLSLCLLSTFVLPSVDTQAQRVQIGSSTERPTVNGVYNLNIKPGTKKLQLLPKTGPALDVELDSTQVPGLIQSLQRIRNAAASGVSSGSGNVSQSTVKPVTDALYPTLGRDAKQYGVTANSMGDQATSFAQAFAVQSEVILPPGEYSAAEIIIPSGKTLELGMGATIKGLSLSSAQLADHSGLIKIMPGGRLTGNGIIDGNASGRNSINAHGVYFINSDSVQITGNLTVRNCGGSGIRYQNSHAAVINNVKVMNCGNVGIENVTSDYARIIGPLVTNCEHGIQWWGNPAFNDYSDGFTISGAIVKNIRGGGIWGYCGRSASVTGNSVEECGDVLLDFEKCFKMTVTGNTGKNGRNAGLAWFHGSKGISFTGNDIVQDVGYGPAAKGYGPDLSEDITITGGSLETKGDTVAAIYTDAGYTKGLRLIGVTVNSGDRGVEGQLIDDFEATSCIFNVKGLIGIQNTGGNRGKIENNTIVYSGTNAAAAKAVYIAWADVSHQAQYNSIKNNIAPTFLLGIHNDAWGNNAGFNTIADNTVTMVTTPGGVNDLSTIERNHDLAGNYVDGTPVNGVLTYATYTLAVSGTTGRKKPARVHVLNDEVNNSGGFGKYDYSPSKGLIEDIL